MRGLQSASAQIPVTTRVDLILEKKTSIDFLSLICMLKNYQRVYLQIKTTEAQEKKIMQ